MILKRIVTFLTIGISIGFLIPFVLMYIPVISSDDNMFFEGNNSHRENKVLAEDEGQISSSQSKYYARIDEGTLTIVQGDHVIISGIDISKWPTNRLDSIINREFNNLDEVQSFIDSISEELRSR